MPSPERDTAVYSILIYALAWVRLCVALPTAISAFRLASEWRADLDRLLNSNQNGMQEVVLRTAVRSASAFSVVSLLFMALSVINIGRGVASVQSRGVIDVVAAAIVTGVVVYVAYVVSRKRLERTKLGELSRRHAED